MQRFILTFNNRLFSIREEITFVHIWRRRFFSFWWCCKISSGGQKLFVPREFTERRLLMFWKTTYVSWLEKSLVCRNVISDGKIKSSAVGASQATNIVSLSDCLFLRIWPDTGFIEQSQMWNFICVTDQWQKIEFTLTDFDWPFFWSPKLTGIVYLKVRQNCKPVIDRHFRQLILSLPFYSSVLTAQTLVTRVA